MCEPTSLLWCYDNGDIIPFDEVDKDTQKIFIFNDSFRKKTRKLPVDYFIRGRHKYCSIIICLRAFIKHQKTFPWVAVIMLFITSQVAMKETWYQESWV